ncbi:hypothetical protein BJX76DRAFT_318538 [Aspergillus varians]
MDLITYLTPPILMLKKPSVINKTVFKKTKTPTAATRSGLAFSAMSRTWIHPRQSSAPRCLSPSVSHQLPATNSVRYEPYWFRTFRLMRVEVIVGTEPVTLIGLETVQVNYPLAVKASWNDQGDLDSQSILDISIRTMRNCMFDRCSDCPFYEQLQ